MTPPAAPDWLKQRDGTLTPGLREYIALVVISNRPEYRLEVRPAQGQHECLVFQSVNGKLLDDGAAIFATVDAAFTGGLDRLRAKLGW